MEGPELWDKSWDQVHTFRTISYCPCLLLQRYSLHLGMCCNNYIENSVLPRKGVLKTDDHRQ